MASWLAGSLVAGLGLSVTPVRADLRPVAGLRSLGSQVGCAGGQCVISGGVRRAGNRFHRFAAFDTRSQQGEAIDAVTIRNRSGESVIMAVLHHTWIHRPVSLARSGDLMILSPQGFTLQSGAAFGNVQTLLLTTASQISLAIGANFHYADSLATSLQTLPGFEAPPPSSTAAVLALRLREGSLLGEGFFADENGSVEIAMEPGVSLAVDRSLLLVGNRAPIRLSGVTLTAHGRGEGDGLAIISQTMAIDAAQLHTNAGFTLREPKPVRDPGQGVLAAPIVPSHCATGGTPISCATFGQSLPDTLSNLQIHNTTIRDAGDPAPSWTGLISVIGWGCRNFGAACPLQPLSPDGLQTYAPLGFLSTDPAAPGRLGFRGLDLNGLTIAPQGAISNLDITLAVDWGRAQDLTLISPASLQTRALRFQAGNRAPIVPSPIALDSYRNSFTPSLTFEDPRLQAFAQGWSKGKIDDVSNPALQAVRYGAAWWDGGDVTFNNIQIVATGPGVLPPNPANGVATGIVPAAALRDLASQALDQVEFNLEQLVFADATAAPLSTADSGVSLAAAELTAAEIPATPEAEPESRSKRQPRR